MEIKGTSVKITSDFVKAKYPSKHAEWLKEMPPPSRKIFEEIIASGAWYELMDAVITPTQVLAKVCFNNDAKKLSWEIGKYSCKAALTGIYRAFFLVTSTKFVLERAKSVWGTYYKPCQFDIVKSGNDFAEFKIEGYKYEEAIIFQRFGGWIEGLFELSKQINKGIDIKVVPNGKLITAHINARWA